MSENETTVSTTKAWETNYVQLLCICNQIYCGMWNVCVGWVTLSLHVSSTYHTYKFLCACATLIKNNNHNSSFSHCTHVPTWQRLPGTIADGSMDVCSCFSKMFEKNLGQEITLQQTRSPTWKPIWNHLILVIFAFGIILRYCEDLQQMNNKIYDSNILKLQ